jgi:hypothetical protein
MAGLADILGLNPQTQATGPTNLNAANTAVNGLPPEFQPKPPASQEELAARVNGWQAIQQKMQDPNVGRALMFFGQALGVPLAPNETPLGRGLQGMGVGVGAYNLGQLAEEEQAKRGAELERIQATTDLERVRTDQTRGQESRAQELHPQELQKAAAEIARLEAMTGNANAEARKRQLEADIVEKYGMTQALEAINTERERQRSLKASAASSYATAGAANETMLARRQERLAIAGLPTADDLRVNPESMTPQQEFYTSTGRFAKPTSGGTAAEVQRAQEYARQWKVANPKGAQESEEQYNQRQARATQEFMDSKKGLNPRDRYLAFLRDTMKEDSDATWQEFQRIERRFGEGGDVSPGAVEMVWDPKQRKYVPKPTK